MMFSFIFVTHSDLGASLVRTAEFIMQEDFKERCEAFSIDYSMLADMNRIKELLERSVDRFLGMKHKVIIFVDIFGGSPSNVAFTFVKRDGVDVITGVNLPMVIYAFEHREHPMTITQMAAGIIQSGDDNLISAKKLLEKENR
jgi:PTS system mannose-specific IIA component